MGAGEKWLYELDAHVPNVIRSLVYREIVFDSGQSQKMVKSNASISHVPYETVVLRTVDHRKAPETS